jgi:hypothetical protein
VSPHERIGPNSNDQTILQFVEELQANGNGSSTNKAIPLLREAAMTLKKKKSEKQVKSSHSTSVETKDKLNNSNPLTSSASNSSSTTGLTDKDSTLGLVDVRSSQVSSQVLQSVPTSPSTHPPPPKTTATTTMKTSLSQSSLINSSSEAANMYEDERDQGDEAAEEEDDEEWSETTGPFSSFALQYPLLWPPPKHCRPLPGGDCLLGRESVAWLPEGASVEVAGVRSAAWIKLNTTLVNRGVTLTPTRGGGGTSGRQHMTPHTQRSHSFEYDRSRSGTGGGGEDDDDDGIAASRGLALVLNACVLPHPSSFRLTVCAQGVALIAADPEGLLFGTFCLCQLIEFYSSEVLIIPFLSLSLRLWLIFNMFFRISCS